MICFGLFPKPRNGLHVMYNNSSISLLEAGQGVCEVIMIGTVKSYRNSMSV